MPDKKRSKTSGARDEAVAKKRVLSAAIRGLRARVAAKEMSSGAAMQERERLMQEG